MEILYLACEKEKIFLFLLYLYCIFSNLFFTHKIFSCTLIDRKSRLTFTDKNLEKTLEMLFSFDPKGYIVKDEPLNIKVHKRPCLLPAAERESSITSHLRTNLE